MFMAAPNAFTLPESHTYSFKTMSTFRSKKKSALTTSDPYVAFASLPPSTSRLFLALLALLALLHASLF
jgi:hypothetical protein